MRQQLRIEHGQLGIGNAVFLDAVVARLVMLQAFFANNVAEAEKKMVGLVMSGLIEGARLPAPVG